MNVGEELHHEGDFWQHSGKAMSYKYNTPQIEMYVAFLAQFVL